MVSLWYKIEYARNRLYDVQATLKSRQTINANSAYVTDMFSEVDSVRADSRSLVTV